MKSLYVWLGPDSLEGPTNKHTSIIAGHRMPEGFEYVAESVGTIAISIEAEKFELRCGQRGCACGAQFKGNSRRHVWRWCRGCRQLVVSCGRQFAVLASVTRDLRDEEKE